MTNVLQVKQVAERYNVEGSMCTEVADYNILMRSSVLLFSVTSSGHLSQRR